jgi:predicted phage tail protein
MPLTTIYLKGDLADLFTAQFRANVNSVREAIRALEANFNGFRQHLMRSDQQGIGYKVVVGEAWELDQSQLLVPTGRSPITIIPVVGGSGVAGKIIAGAALLGLGLTGVGLLGFSAATVALTGGVLLLGGIMSLFNRPKDDKDEKKATLAFNGPVNTVGAGGVVPVVYGELIVGSQVISAQIRTETQLEDDDDD